MELRLQDEREDGKGERMNKYVNCRVVALDVNVLAWFLWRHKIIIIFGTYVIIVNLLLLLLLFTIMGTIIITVPLVSPLCLL